MRQSSFTLALVFTVAIYTTAVGASAVVAAEDKQAGPWHLTTQLDGCCGDESCFSADGSLLLTAGGDGVRVWDARTFKPLTPPLSHQLDQRERPFPNVSCYGWNPKLSEDGRRVLTGIYEEARLWDARTGRQIQVFEQGKHQLAAALNGDGSRVATVFESKRGDFTPSEVRIWDSRTGKALLSLRHDHLVEYVSFTHDGSGLLSIEWVDWHERIYHVWEIRSGKERFAPIRPPWNYDYNWNPGHASGVLSPDGKKLVVTGTKNRAGFMVFDAETGNEKAGGVPSPYDNWANEVKSVGFTADGATILAVHSLFAGLFDAATARPMPEQLHISVEHWGLSAGGSKVVCTYYNRGMDGMIEDRLHTGVWDLTTGKQLQALPDERISAVAFSPDGKRVAASTEEHTTVWRIPGGP